MEKEIKVHISNGNMKLGQIPNTSFPPIITCRKDAPCCKKCYARKSYRMYPSVRNAWDENWRLYCFYREKYWADLSQAVMTTRYFRYFVSGDIPDGDYLLHMIDLAEKRPHTEFLCFTKQYEIVNDVLNDFEKPDNLHLILSCWEGFEPENPHNLPVARVIFKGNEVPEDWKICGGNCTECACRGVGCWQIGAGETIAFYEH